MKFFKGIVPNISIVLTLTLIVVLILDRRNPMMGFLSGRPGSVLIIACAVFSLISAVTLYASWRKEK